MELFNEVKNQYFHLVFKVLQLSNKGLSEKEIREIVDKEEYEEKVIGKDFKTFDGLLLNKYNNNENFKFLAKKEDKYYPIVNNKNLAVRFTVIEKLWLKEFIRDKVVQNLLGETIIAKLQESLKDIEFLNIKSIIDITNSANDDKRIRRNFNNVFFDLINAIIEERVITYSNTDKQGNYYKDQLALPIRIEYNMKSNTYSVNMYSIIENRNILVSLNTIHNIKFENNIVCNLTRSEVLEGMKEKKYAEEPVTVQVVDEKGAMERFFMLFSQYERSSRYLGNNKYEVKVSYYTFEEREVITKLVSLGPYVKVIEPIAIKNGVISEIVKALELCSR